MYVAVNTDMISTRLFFGILFLLQYPQCRSKDLEWHSECPKYKKDIQWNNGDKGIEGSANPKSALDCQIWCQGFKRHYNPCPFPGGGSSGGCTYYPCAAWTFWPDPGPWSSSGSWCELFQLPKDQDYHRNIYQPLNKTAEPSPGAVSGYAGDCGIAWNMEADAVVDGRGPTIGEYFLEGVNSIERYDRRNNILPNDTDIDKDGSISDNEIKAKFDWWMEELFKTIDQNYDGIVTEEELESLRFKIPHDGNNRLVDIAMDVFPIKSFLHFADKNNDGVFDENDFYTPEKFIRGPLMFESSQDSFTTVELIGDEPGHTNEGQVTSYPRGEPNVCDIGTNEATVICKSLGFEDMLEISRPQVSPSRYSYESGTKYTCQGDETNLEDCQSEYLNRCTLNIIKCKQSIGSLRLVGGKDSSSGDIFLGGYSLPSSGYDYKLNKTSQVVCRELGFSGFVKATTRSLFSHQVQPRPPVLKLEFNCAGHEAKLEDCPKKDTYWHDGWDNVQGVVCKTDSRKDEDVNEDLERLFNWRYNYILWERLGKFVFGADTDSGKIGQVTFNEIALKLKKYLEVILQLVDQTGDGYISFDDLTTLNITEKQINDIIEQLVHPDGPDGPADLNILKPVFMTRDLSQYIPWILTLDKNLDKRLNAADFYDLKDGRSKTYKMEEYMIPALSQLVDRDQDGRMESGERLVRDVFKKVDADGSGTLTFNDLYKQLDKLGYSCLQILQVETYVTHIVDMIKSKYKTMVNLLAYNWDYDGNGEITLEEFQKMHLPCTVGYIPGSRQMGCYWFQKVYFDDIVKQMRAHFPVLDPAKRGDDLANYACQLIMP